MTSLLRAILPKLLSPDPGMRPDASTAVSDPLLSIDSVAWILQAERDVAEQEVAAQRRVMEQDRANRRDQAVKAALEAAERARALRREC